jgi:hypothetical protein
MAPPLLTSALDGSEFHSQAAFSPGKIPSAQWI